MSLLKFLKLKSLTKPTDFLRTISTTRTHFKKKDIYDDYEEVKPPPKPEDHPFKRTYNILSHDFRSIVDKKQAPLLEFPSHCDIAIIGGGIMGAAIAYHLKSRLPLESLAIVVIERDPAYTRSSTVLSVGGLRQQFSLKENVQMSMYSAEFLRKASKHLAIEDSPPPDIQFHPQGYLFLAPESGAEQLLKNYEVQKSCGAKIKILNKTQLKERYPWMNVDDIELGSLGLENEGWFDPWALLFSYKRKAISLGVEFVNAEVIGFEFNQRRDVSVSGQLEGEFYEGIEQLIVKNPRGEHKSIKSAMYVLAAGYESGKIAEMARLGRRQGILSVPLPVEPRKRYVYSFHAPDGPTLDCPLLIDPSGAYFRREGLSNHYIGGQSPAFEEEPNVENLDVDYSFWENTVWPNLAKRVPAFNNLKIKSAWAGYYDYNTFDQNAIIGQHPYHYNMFFATGFSGHGIQQAPAVGHAISELILDGEFKTIDLSNFNFERLIVGREVKEQNCV